MARIWLDDVRPAPEGFIWCQSVNKAKFMITQLENKSETIDLIDCDHDLGDYAAKGGDGIKLLDWLVETRRFYPVRIHTQNVVGRKNMELLVQRHWPLKDQFYH